MTDLDARYWPSRKWSAKGESKLCPTPEDVPEGYADSPQEAAQLSASKSSEKAATGPSDYFWAQYGETRESAEKEAKRLGVSFNSRTPDQTLAERVAEALAAEKNAEAPSETADDAAAE